MAPALCGSCPWGHSQVHLRGMLHALRAGRPRPSAGHAQPRRDRQVCLDAQLRGLLWVLLLLLWLCCGSSQVGTTACRGARWRPLYHDEPSRLHMSLRVPPSKSLGTVESEAESYSCCVCSGVWARHVSRAKIRERVGIPATATPFKSKVLTGSVSLSRIMTIAIMPPRPSTTTSALRVSDPRWL